MQKYVYFVSIESYSRQPCPARTVHGVLNAHTNHPSNTMQLSPFPLRLIILPLLLIVCMQELAAQHRLTGTVRDAETGEALQFANVWVRGSSKGTTTDRQGRYSLVLESGAHTIVASYIGYASRSRVVQLPGETALDFSLPQRTYEMQSVTVTPGDNPALRIIRKAIEMKEQRRARLRNYSLTSHSKLLVRVSGLGDGSVEGSSEGDRMTLGFGVGDEKDSTARSDSAAQDLPIILETQTTAYWAAPDRYKEIIDARKQSAVIPAKANIMISEFFIVDFSADEFSFSDRVPIPGPISERGLTNYYYRLIGTTTLDSTKIYQIEISALSDNDPLFEGMIYIADSTYALSMVDLHLNDAAMPQFFESLAFKQHFRLFDGEFWQPVDVVVDAGIRIPIVNLGIGIEGFSVLQDWRINQPINEEFFDRTRIKVLKEADERDSVYWMQNAKIPSTNEEQRAYVRADSLKTVLDSTRYAVTFNNFITGGTTGSEEAEFTFPGLIEMYHFNRVEGHAVRGEMSLRLPKAPLRSIIAGAGYGFSDERLKWHVGAGVSLLNSPALSIFANRYHSLGFIDADNDPLSALGTTIASLLWKYDPHDYFYRDGWSASLHYDPFMLFPMSVSFRRDNFFNALKSTDQSIFRKDWLYRDNPPINEGSILSVAGEVTLDARDFIDNAGELSRFGSRNHVPVLGLAWHEADLEGSQWNFTTWKARLNGEYNIGLLGIISYRLAADAADGALPTQMLFNLQGSVDYQSDPRRFRTLEFREFGGDRRVTAQFTYDFRDWLFRTIGVPLLKSSGIGLELFASGGWTTMTSTTRALQTVPVSESKRPFWEAGFGLENILTIFRIDFGWRLNHFREGRNFFFGINAGVLL
jgi:hypothetical protein